MAAAASVSALVACGSEHFVASNASDASTLDGAPAADSGVSDAVANDGGAPGDGGRLDGAVVSACPLNEVSCGGTCIVGVDCTGCASAKLFCAGTRTCGTTCDECNGETGSALPIQCFACDSAQANPIGTCEPAVTAYCLSGDYGKAYRGSPAKHCDCNNTMVSECPGSTQVCEAEGGIDNCITCGENAQGTNGRPCKGGGTCDTTTSTPRCH